MKTHCKKIFQASLKYQGPSRLTVLLTSIFSILLQVNLHGQSWNALGDGLNSGVLVLVVHENEIYAGGYFTDAGGNPDADHLARWDGKAWHAVAPGLNNGVNAIAFSGEDIYVGGSFTQAGGNNNANFIARWDGSNWHALHQGLNHHVQAISVSGNKVYVGGWFTNVAGIDSIDHLAIWENSSWGALGPTIIPFNLGVNTIVPGENSDLYVGGDFLNAGGVEHTSRIARWDGSTWHPLGTGFWGDMGVTSIAVNENNIYVGGDGGVWDTIGCGILRWDGNRWNPLGERGLSNCIYGDGAWSIASQGNATYVGGIFANAGNIPGTAYLAKWDGDKWSSLGETGFEWKAFNPNIVNAIAIHGDDVYVGGGFPGIGNVMGTQNIARWNDALVSTYQLHEESRTIDLQVFPNPAEDIIEYALENPKFGRHTVSISNATGELVFSESRVNSQLDISFLSSGIYFLQVENEKSQGFAKLVKL